MKTLLTSLLISMTLALSAQRSPQMAQITIDDAERPAIALLIDLPIDEARDRYEDFVSDQYDIDVDGNGWLSNKSLLCSEKVTISALSANAVDLFAHFTQVDEQSTRVALAAREGYDLYYSKGYKAEKYQVMEGMLNDYAVKASIAYHQEQLEERMKMKEDLMRDQEKLAKDITKNKEDIQKNIEDNKEMTKENEKMTKELNELKSQLNELDGRIRSTKEKIAVSTR